MLGMKNSIEDDATKRLIDFRFNQSIGSRLIEHITGLRPDNPEMGKRLVEDQKILRAKYNLPSRNLLHDSPAEYEQLLNEIAKKNNVVINDKSECGRFFQEHPFANGAYMDDSNSVAVGIDRNDSSLYKKGLATLEHELIHSEQEALYENMPIELREYEAYIAANINVHLLKESSPEDIETVLNFFIGGSVNIWYKQLNEKNKNESKPLIEPKWDDPVFFLKNIDKVGQNVIDAYREKTNEDSVVGQANS